MKTKTLQQFISEEITNDIESGFMFMIGNSVQEDIKAALSNPGVKMNYYNKMIARFEKLQAIGKISGLVKNEDLSISFL